MNEAATSPSSWAPWLQRQLSALIHQPGHARLLAGPSGLGQYPLALALARAWLCEQPAEQGACGDCASCHAIDVRTHADLCVLMPETTMLELGWPLAEKAQAEIDEKKRKASKEIKIDAMREAVEFAQRTSARGHGKVILVYPAERMNHITANALLKTLEEPAGELKFVLATEAAHLLLPTIQSRCQQHTLVWPESEAALQWMQKAGVDATLARTMLRAAGGRPDDAIDKIRAGMTAKVWSGLPKALAQGDAQAVKDWPAPELLNALQKVCHDLVARLFGAAPRFFELADLPPGGSLSSLNRWARDLAAARKSMEHPFNAGLMTEALVAAAENALNSGSGKIS